MSQTPIYDQLRGERINADVPASAVEGADPQRGSPRGRHHLLADASGAVGAVWMLLERAKAVAGGGARGAQGRRAPAHALEDQAPAAKRPPTQPGAAARLGDGPSAGSPGQSDDRFSWFDVVGEARC